MGKGVYAGVLGAALVVYWLVLSGIYSKGLLLTLGAISVFVVVAYVDRLGIVDEETIPARRFFSIVAYWGWLGGEIAKSAVAVSRLTMRADLDVTPRLLRVAAPLKTDMGRVIFANSITLTPGTVTIDVGDDEFLVHALDESFADPSAFVGMCDQVARAAEGGR